MALTGVPPAIFMRDGNPEDPRSQRSRRSVLETFEEEIQLGRRPATVAELVRTAGVSRSTFYSHFADLDEVGVAALRDILFAFGATTEVGHPGVGSARSGPTASLRDLFAHLHAHQALCRALLSVDGGKPHPAAAELRAVLVEHFESSISALDLTLPVDAHTTALFVVGGVMALIVDWLGNGSTSPTVLADAVATLLPDWLRDSDSLARPLHVTNQAP